MLLIDWASHVNLSMIEVKAMCDVVVDFGLFLSLRQFAAHWTGGAATRLETICRAVRLDSDLRPDFKSW